MTWLHADVDKLFERFGQLYIRVVDQGNVEVLTPAYGRLLFRSRVAKCAAFVPRHKFGQQMTQEDFLIYLQTCFDPTEDFDVVAKLVGTNQDGERRGKRGQRHFAARDGQGWRFRSGQRDD